MPLMLSVTTTEYFFTCMYIGPSLQEFNKRVLKGYQVSPLWNQGSIHDDGRYLFLWTTYGF